MMVQHSKFPGKPDSQVSGLLFFKPLAFLIIGLALFNNCGNPKTDGEMGRKELDKAIKAMEQRRDAEQRVIDQESEMIAQLLENREKARSMGMRDKISRDISMKEVVLERAEHNKLNQEKILEGLYAKRDSMDSL